MRQRLLPQPAFAGCRNAVLLRVDDGCVSVPCLSKAMCMIVHERAATLSLSEDGSLWGVAKWQFATYTAS